MGKFANKSKGTPSKRRTLKDKYKIEKRVSQHNKKTRRMAKKMQEAGRRRRNPKQQPLPNLYPFKAEIMEAAKLQKIQQKKQKNKKMAIQTIQQEANRHAQNIQELIETSDVIIEVLDARDPQACRSKKLQQLVSQNAHKRLILLLNKIDLVPLDVAYAWQAKLSKQYPTVLFRATTQNIYNAVKPTNEQQTVNEKRLLGVGNLLHFIRKQFKLHAVIIGVIGYNRVGKQSVIQMIKKLNHMIPTVQQSDNQLKIVALDKQISLVQSTGLIQDQKPKDSLILKTLSQNDIQYLLTKIERQELLTHYKIQDFNDISDFLNKVAKSTGRLLKGGVPDIKKTQKLVISDWNKGKLLYYTKAPQKN